MFKMSKKVGALALIGALTFGVLGTSQAASAQQIPGVITITPTSGNAADDPFLQRVQVSTGCPAGFRTTSGTFAIQNGLRSSLANARTAATPATDGTTGLDGNPINLNRDISPTNPGVSNKTLDAITNPLATGDWELRVQCFASGFAPDFANDPWFSLAMTFDATTQNWAVKGSVVTPPTASATTTSLTALPNQTTNTVALTATVKKADGTTATDATGAVQFTQGGANIGSPVTVANDVASYTTEALAEGQTYSFTSVFTPTGTAYTGSTSAAATASIDAVVVVPPGGQTDTAVIDVTVPTNTGAVSFAGLADTISLGTATLKEGFFEATGKLGNIVITDTRQLGSTPWSLTGTVTDFLDGTKVLDGKYLGWTPALVARDSAGTAGPQVLPAPATVAGLKAPASVLSSGSVVDGKQTTTVNADLNLKAPGNTPGGVFKSTLTLTLVS